MITDGLDGFLARRYKKTSQLGAFLDPLMDRFFVSFTLIILLLEDQLTLREVTAMLCRDFAVMIFGIYLVIRGKLAKYQFRSIWCGKITTVLQLFVLIALTLHIKLPSYLFASFIILGSLAFIELYFSRSILIQIENKKKV
jgi:phosphatidylglycerophosphate synthase